MTSQKQSQQIMISAPSKTFLLGEYLALAGGPALVINTQPVFECSVVKVEENPKHQGIDPSSPAGKYVTLNAGFFAAYSLDFKDAHRGSGGFGCSSAQFAMLAAFKALVTHDEAWFSHLDSPIEDFIDIPSLLSTYREVAWDGSGLPPSGADVIGQLFGKVTYFNPETNRVKTYDWPFVDIDCFIIKTGIKLATHEHLRTLQDFPTTRLNQILDDAKAAFEVVDTEKFIDCINDYRDELIALNFVAEETQQLLSSLQVYDECLAAKGCGALGADVILVITEKNNSHWLTNWVEEHHLKIVSSSNELSDGIKFYEMV